MRIKCHGVCKESSLGEMLFKVKKFPPHTQPWTDCSFPNSASIKAPSLLSNVQWVEMGKQESTHFIAEKPGKQCLGQVVEENINRERACC